MATTVARLQVVLGVNDSQLRQGLAAARKEIKKFIDDTQKNAALKLTADKSAVINALQDVRNEYQAVASAIAKKPIKITPQVNVDPVEKRLNSLRHRLVTTGFDLQRAGQVMTAGLTVPIVGLGAAAFKTADQFAEAARIIRLGTGATGSQFDSLMNSVRAVGKEVPDTFKEIAQVVGETSDRTGLFGPRLEKLSQQILTFGRATGEKALPSVGIMTRLFADWGLKTHELGTAMEFLFRVQQDTGVSQAKLAKIVTTFGAPLRQMGFDFEQATATIAKFEKEGVNTETLLAGLRLALGRFAKEGIKDPQLALKLLAERFKAVGSAGEANALAVAVFGRRAGADMAAAVREGRFAIDDLLESVRNSDEDMLKAAKGARTMAEELGVLRNEVMLAAEPIAKDLLVAFKAILPDIKNIIGFLSQAAVAFSKLPVPVKAATAGILLAAAAVGPLLIGIGSVVMAIPGFIKILGLATAFLGGPWMIALKLAALAGTAFVAMWVSNLGNFRARTVAFFDWLVVGFKQVWNGLLEIAKAFMDQFVGLWDALVGAVQVVVVAFKRLFLGEWNSAYEEGKEVLRNFIDSVVNLFGTLIPRIFGKIKSLKDMFVVMLGGGSEEQKLAFARSIMQQMKDAVLGTGPAKVAEKSGLKLGRLLGHNIGAGIKGSVSETNAQLDAIEAAGRKKVKLTEGQTQEKRFLKELAGARAAYNELLEGEGTIAQQVAKKYFLLSDARRKELSSILEITKAKREEIEQDKQVREAIERVRAERELLLTRDPTAKVRAQYTKASGELVKTLATEQMALARVKEEQDRINSSRRKFAEAVAEVNEKLRLRHVGQLAQEMADIRHQMPAITEDQARFLAMQVRRNEVEQRNFETQRDLAMQILTVNGAITKSNTEWETFGDQVLDNTHLIQKFVFGLEDANGELQVFGSPMLMDGSKKIANNIRILKQELLDRQAQQAVKALRTEMLVLAADTDEARAALQLFPQEFILFAHSAKDAGSAIRKLPRDFQQSILDMSEQMKQNRVVEATRAVISQVQDVFTNMFVNVRNGFGGMIDSVLQGIDDLLVGIAAKFLAARLTETIIGAIPGAADFLGGVAGNSEAKVQIQAASQSAAILSTAITTSGTAVGTGFTASISAGGAAASAGISGAMAAGSVGISSAIAAGAVTMATFMVNGGVSAGSTIFSEMVAAGAIVAAQIAAAIQSGQGAQSLGLIPGMAGGGRTAPGQTYLVGEEGPELFSSRRGGRIIPNDELGKGGDTHVHFHINNPVDVRQWKASQSQLMSDAMRQAEVARKRNG